MTMPNSSIEDDHETSVSAGQGFTFPFGAKVGRSIGWDIDPLLRSWHEASRTIVFLEWIEHQNKTDHGPIIRISR
jgi:hypothetical protein